MRNFWALPAFLRIAIASSHAFSVFDDLLSFPQYEVVFPNTFITENAASSLLSHPISRSTSSVTPSQETQELSKPGKQTPPTNPDDTPLEETYEAVVLNNQRYLCSIPIIPEEEPQNSTASAEEAKAEEEKELMRASTRGAELLQGMEGSCIYYLSGWWSYSFCYNGEIKQFHQKPPSRNVPIYPPEEDPTVDSYILGRFPEKPKGTNQGKEPPKQLDGEQSGHGSGEEANAKTQQPPKPSTGGSDIARLETRGNARYMVQKLGGGTRCDLLRKDRNIEIQFHCQPQSIGDRISMIKETSTCSYLMVIQTPRLCSDVAFLPPQENLAHPISCRPVISEADVDEWTLQKLEGTIRESEQRLAELENENPLRDMEKGADGRSKKRPVIGGIEVGAQKWVGSEGKVLEKSAIVGGGPEKFIATIATSSGYQMTNEEMKKLGIKDPDDVVTWKNKLAKKSKNAWKLDLVDTARGPEFRWMEEEYEEEPNLDDKADKGQGGPKSNSRDQSNRKDGKGTRQGKQEEAESEEGSEEVFKDEL